MIDRCMCLLIGAFPIGECPIVRFKEIVLRSETCSALSVFVGIININTGQLPTSKLLDFFGQQARFMKSPYLVVTSDTVAASDHDVGHSLPARYLTEKILKCFAKSDVRLFVRVSGHWDFLDEQIKFDHKRCWIDIVDIQ